MWFSETIIRPIISAPQYRNCKTDYDVLCNMNLEMYLLEFLVFRDCSKRKYQQCIQSWLWWRLGDKRWQSYIKLLERLCYILRLVLLKEEASCLRLMFLNEGISPHLPVFLHETRKCSATTFSLSRKIRWHWESRQRRKLR